jgi:hypothetical protein
MKKIITTAIVSATLCFPSVALAQTMPQDGSFTSEDFDSMEDCEEARAEERRDQSMDLRGRERGQFNKAFNQRFQCDQTEGESTSTTRDDEFMIEDSEDDES